MFWFPYNPRVDRGTIREDVVAFFALNTADEECYFRYDDFSERHALTERGLHIWRHRGGNELRSQDGFIEYINSLSDRFHFLITGDVNQFSGANVLEVEERATDTLAGTEDSTLTSVNFQAVNGFPPEGTELIRNTFESQGGLGRIDVRISSDFRNKVNVLGHRLPTRGMVSNRPTILLGYRPAISIAEGGSVHLEQSFGQATTLADGDQVYNTTLEQRQGDQPVPANVRGEVLYGTYLGVLNPICYRMFAPFNVLYWLDSGWTLDIPRGREFTAEIAQQILDIYLLTEEEYLVRCEAGLTQILEISRQNFAQQYVSNITRSTRSVRNACDRAARDLSSYASGWENALRAYQTCVAELAVALQLEGSDVELLAVLQAKIAEVEQLTPVVSVSVNLLGQLEVLTNTLYCHSRHRGTLEWRLIGQVKIVIDPSRSTAEEGISLFNQTHPNLHRGGGSCHAMFRDGGTCWGNAGRALGELHQQGDLADLVTYIINFIESPPGADGYRTFETVFPRCDPPT